MFWSEKVYQPIVEYVLNARSGLSEWITATDYC